MRKDRIVLLREFLITQMNHWIFFLVAITLYGLIGLPTVSLWKWIVLSMVPYVFFLVRKYTDQFIIFIGSHVFVIGLFYLLMPKDPLAEYVALILYAIVYAGISFYLRIRTQHRQDEGLNPIAAVVGATVGLFIQNHFGNGQWDNYYPVPIILFVGCYLIQLYLERYLYFVKVNEVGKGHIQEKAMFQTGIKTVVLFTVFSMAVVSMTGNINWVSQILNLFKKLLLKLFWLIGLFIDDELEVGVADEEDMRYFEADTQSTGEKLGGGETGVVWEFLEKAGAVIFGIAIAAFAIFVIYKLITSLHKWFQGGSKRAKVLDKEDENYGDVRERLVTEKKVKERKSPFEFLSTKERIRRVYKKEVWARRSWLVADGSPAFLRVMTAKECGEKMERYALAEAYEKARYSDEECTSEDFRHAKEK